MITPPYIINSLIKDTVKRTTSADFATTFAKSFLFFIDNTAFL